MADGIIWGTTKLVASTSMAADITAVINLKAARHVHLQFASAATGDRAGVIYVQTSSDASAWTSKKLINSSTGASVDYITVSTLTAVTDTVDVETDAQYLRVFWDVTSGTGTLDCWATVKA
jgi:hypothetical protein